MMFQMGFSGSASGLVNALQQWGFVDLIIPFTLIFAVLFAILKKTSVFGPGKEPDKYYTIIAIAIALLIVVPHALNPSQNDVVNVINRFLPEFVFVTIALLILLILVGLVGSEKTAVGSPLLVGLAGVLAIIYLGFVILNAVSPSAQLPAFLSDPNFQALVIIILVLGLLIYYISGEESSTKWYDGLANGIKKIFGG